VYVAHMGEMHTKSWFENLKGRDHLEGQGIGGRIILEWILGKTDVDWVHLAKVRDQ